MFLSKCSQGLNAQVDAIALDDYTVFELQHNLSDVNFTDLLLLSLSHLKHYFTFLFFRIIFY